MLSVPKEAFLKADEKWKAAQAKKRAKVKAQKPASDCQPVTSPTTVARQLS